MTAEKKLYRSRTTKTFGGVCGGLAEHFSLDPVIVRIVFVLAAIFGGGGLIIYIVLWIIIPLKPFVLENTTNSEPINSDTNNITTMENPFEQEKKRRNYHSNLTGGLILITLGILFLIDRFVPQVNFGDLWPVILIVIGITILMRNFPKKNNNNPQQ